VKKESPRRRVRRVDTKLLSFDWGAFGPLSLVHGISEVPNGRTGHGDDRRDSVCAFCLFPGRPTSSSHFFFAKYIHEMQFLLETEGVTKSLECFLAELNCSSFCTVDLC